MGVSCQGRPRLTLWARARARSRILENRRLFHGRRTIIEQTRSELPDESRLRRTRKKALEKKPPSTGKHTAERKGGEAKKVRRARCRRHLSRLTPTPGKSGCLPGTLFLFSLRVSAQSTESRGERVLLPLARVVLCVVGSDWQV